MPITGYLSTLPSDLLLLPGVLRAGSTNVGVTRGGGSFDPAFEIENVDFDGKQANVKLHDRKFNGTPKISLTLIEFGDASTGDQIPKLENTSSTATAGSPAVTTITPDAGGPFIATGDYIANLRWCFDRGIGAGDERYCCILFAAALCTKYSISAEGGSRKEAEIHAEFEGRVVPGTVADSAYVIELRNSLP